MEKAVGLAANVDAIFSINPLSNYVTLKKQNNCDTKFLAVPGAVCVKREQQQQTEVKIITSLFVQVDI